MHWVNTLALWNRKAELLRFCGLIGSCVGVNDPWVGLLEELNGQQTDCPLQASLLRQWWSSDLLQERPQPTEVQLSSYWLLQTLKL